MRKVSDVMTAEVRSVASTEVIGEVRDLLLDGRIHAVPVTDATGRVVGILSSLDLVEEWSPHQGVVTVMSSDVRFVDPATSLADAARAIRDGRFHHLVVIEDGCLVGIVSSLDLLGELAEELIAAPPAEPPTATTPDGGVQPGDLVSVRAQQLGTRERRGLVARVGAGGTPPYIVHWLDDPHDPPHDVMFFPGSDAHFERPVEVG